MELNLVGGKDLTILAAGFVDFAQVGRELETINTTTIVTNNDDRLVVVEADMCELGALYHLLLAQRLVLVFSEVKYVHLERKTSGN